MRNDRTMKIIISSILIFYTIIQVFYFAQIDIIPTGIFTYKTLMNILFFVLELCILVGLSILITYILPIVCIVKIYRLNIALSETSFPKAIKQVYAKKSLTLVNKNKLQKLQVIRC
ncbi:hypothetical protein KQ51_00954 [Candidatus Izimaplasma bacterium HR1]|jgi:hypothetical protein|nr:hypothetical protein KQ51_00954 [Candidatus Izimaplasma bacterium HR1]